MTDKPNAGMDAFWNGDGGNLWVSFESRLEAGLKPFGKRVLDSADPSWGEVVLEIGCGCGPNSIELAHRVGPAGSVTALDISTTILDSAKVNVEASGLANISFECADAQTANLGQEKYDLVFSRFGVMFFDDPVVAFENIRSALKSEGRLNFACWASRAENTWVAEPTAVVAKHIEMPPPPPPHAPGPFALGDEKYVRDILGKAGFKNINVTPFKAPMLLGENITAAVEYLTRMSPSGGAISAANPNDQTRSAIAADLATLLESHQGDRGVTMDAMALIVTANKC